MKYKIELNQANYLTYRPTPWDTKVFGFLTNEIIDIHYDNENYLDELLKRFIEECEVELIRFSYLRIDANDLILKKYLQKNGFYYAETTQIVYNSRLQKLDIDRIYKSTLTIAKPIEVDFKSIKEIAERAFNYSRFHEDNNIPIELSRKRYYDWIDDLVKQNKSFLVHKKDDEIISFMAFEESEVEVEFILGGSDVGKGHISPFFWSALLKYFQDKNINKVKEIKVSAANIGILNLYISFNFKVKKTLLGYHRFNINHSDI
jgi:hypothetical protein